MFSSNRLEEELERTSHHASTNVDLHVYTQKLENECRDLRSQITIREKEKLVLNEIIADFEVQVSILFILQGLVYINYFSDQTSAWSTRRMARCL